MNRFLLGVLAMGAVFVLTSFAVHTAADPAMKKNGPAWRVSDYQLDRAFRIPLAYNSSGGLATLSGQVPQGGGFIITQIVGQNTAFNVTVVINGVSEVFSANQYQIELNPPIIARPGDIVTVSYYGGPTIGGYTTLPGET